MRRLLTGAAALFCIGFMPVAAVMIAAGGALLVWSVTGLLFSPALDVPTRRDDVAAPGRCEAIAWGLFVATAATLLLGELILRVLG